MLTYRNQVDRYAPTWLMAAVAITSDGRSLASLLSSAFADVDSACCFGCTEDPPLPLQAVVRG
jgi:hypothetical protein